MKEQIIRKEGRDIDKLVWQALIECMVVAADKDITSIPEWSNIGDQKEVRVVFALNGVDLPFETILERFSDRIRERIQNEAQELYDERVRDYELAYEDELGELEASILRLREDFEKRIKLKFNIDVKDPDLCRDFYPDIHNSAQLDMACHIARLEKADFALADESIGKYLPSNSREDLRRTLQNCVIQMKADFDNIQDPEVPKEYTCGGCDSCCPDEDLWK